jgi:4-alpha-glucanotransferase
MGVHTRYIDGLGKPVRVAPETLLRVCAALGAPIEWLADAPDALRAHKEMHGRQLLPPVLVAWDGVLSRISLPEGLAAQAHVQLADSDVVRLEQGGTELRLTGPLPPGYHRLTLDAGNRVATATVIAAPVRAWRRTGSYRSWGIGTHLAALRSARSRSVGDLRDLASFCRWIRERGGDLVTVLPLLPTFNTEPAEPSPYSPVSRLFWSELMVDLEDAHRPTASPASLDVKLADAEVRAALADRAVPDPTLLDDELVRYARFRGAQVRLGRNWRDWPANARGGCPKAEDVDPGEERFQLVAQSLLRKQLEDLKQQLGQDGMRLGLDLAVGVHPDGYDSWSRQSLFGEGMSVGAPPDQGFPSGQDWGFTPVLPEASRREGHRYLAASLAHQARLAGVLRIDHIMAWTRLYWIPHGMGVHEGTYVSYPAEELFAMLTLESTLHQCEVVGENLGNVPREIDAALPHHGIWGMYLAEFQSPDQPDILPPTEMDVALVGTHDTPTFAGWLTANDVGERVRYDLLPEHAAPGVRDARARAAHWLADRMNSCVDEPQAFLAELLAWLGRSKSPLVIPWLEDLWLEDRGVNLPGTRSSDRPNWQRPMSRLLDEIFTDAQVEDLLRRLNHARGQ